jgi:hypothetical protein
MQIVVHRPEAATPSVSATFGKADLGAFLRTLWYSHDAGHDTPEALAVWDELADAYGAAFGSDYRDD